jgi:hypothetical protein
MVATAARGEQLQYESHAIALLPAKHCHLKSDSLDLMCPACVLHLFSIFQIKFKSITVAKQSHEMPSPVETLGQWVRIPLEVRMSLLSCISKGLATWPITPPWGFT